jgi:hypothetical protein
MVVVVPELTGYAVLRHVYVSVPYVACLLDGMKYLEQPPPAETRDLRKMRRQDTPRPPTLHAIVRHAVR